MCGFIGKFSVSKLGIDPVRFKSAIKLIEHRGPDSQGVMHVDTNHGSLDLGFRRLAIIDQSSAANQPFISESNRFVILFNGEIYNYLELRHELEMLGYRFRTKSDTEVLLACWAEWGVDSFEKLTGMFSAVIYDRINDYLTAFRDAFGIKPLFYSSDSSGLAFASEISALLALTGRKPKLNNPIAEDYIISGRYDRSRSTFFDGVFQLEPGHYFSVNLRDVSRFPVTQRWWNPIVDVDESITFEEASEKVREEFLASVSMHLRSDVKVATALSGGLDSSAIVAVIRSIEPDLPIHTFSYLAANEKFDESQWIQISNTMTGSTNHSIEIRSSEFLRDLDDLILSQNEPFGSTSLYAQFRIYKAARESGVTVVLDGQGADEIFAGYFGYPENRLRSMLDTSDFLSAFRFAREWRKLPERDLTQLIRSEVKMYLHDCFTRLDGKSISESTFLRKLQSKVGATDLGDEYLRDHDWEGRRLIQRLLTEQYSGLLPALLRHSDRNSMRWSIESRVPFLTTKMAHLSASLPENFLLGDKGQTKNVFRHAMRGIVDARILNRMDKIGFQTPEEDWFLPSVYRQSGFLSDIKTLEFMDAKSFLSLFNDERLSLKSERWRAFNLQRWIQLFDVST
jgi:asparagine synthase (glutamine-hydrolysing)